MCSDELLANLDILLLGSSSDFAIVERIYDGSLVRRIVN